MHLHSPDEAIDELYLKFIGNYESKAPIKIQFSESEIIELLENSPEKYPFLNKIPGKRNTIANVLPKAIFISQHLFSQLYFSNIR